MLKGDKVYLRALEPKDVEVLFQWENDTENWRVSHTQVPFSKHMIERFVNSDQDIYTMKQLRFMICESQSHKAIGTLDLFDYEPFHRRVGVGILIAEQSNRQQGYASSSLTLLENYVSERLDVKNLYCNILCTNKASLALFQKAGYEKAGCKKSWIKTPEGWEDEFLLQKLLNG